MPVDIHPERTIELTSLDRGERGRLREIVGAILLALVVAVPLLYAVKAYAEPRFQVTQDGARVVLHDDKCAVTAITNLPYKATWEEKGKVFQGCWGAHTDAGVVLFYFDDRTVGIIPMQALTPVRGA